MIELITQSLSEFEVRDIVREYEKKVIHPPLKEALLLLRNLGPKHDVNQLRIFQEKQKIEIVISKWDKREIKTTLNLRKETFKDPERSCDCKVGKEHGFCVHFWYALIFGIKKGLMDLSQWNLTILPKNFADLIKPLKIVQIAPNEYRFINENCVEWYA